jgi:hypothetical protein
VLDPFFDYFRKQANPDESLYELCYLSAYDALPTAFQRAPMEFWSTYSRAVQPAYAWYLQMCLLTGAQPSRYDGATFRWHQGHLENGRGYLVLEYPEPPLVELSVDEFDQGDRLPRSLRLYPFYSALLPEIPGQPAACFALGQSPVDELTTLRWCRSAAHYSLGRGPQPRLGDLLDILTEIQEFPVQNVTVRHEDYLDDQDRELIRNLSRPK